MNLLQSLRRRSASTTQRYDGVDFSGIDPLDFAWSFGGTSYQGLPGSTGYRTETLESSFLGLVQGAYKRNSVVFACIRARLSVFSEGRFQFQKMNNGTPGDFFGDSTDRRTAGSSGLGLLENPWPNGTTGDLLTRMLQDADLAGNAYWTVRNGYLRRLRPDWVSIVMGSRDDSRVGPDDLDAELLGYFYWPGGPFNKQSEPVYLLADEVAHFAPTPDPIAHYRGMSWLTPIIREVEADTAATVHKLAFFQNGATLQTIISFKDMKQEVFEAFVKKMDLAHKGAQNAYKTLYLGGGADATVVGADLKQLDFKTVQGAGETRIAAAAGVPPAIVGLSEGLQGSSLNAGNLGQLRRQFAEGTLSTLWRNASASLATLVPPPAGSRLVVDTRYIPFLREDHRDRADIQREQAATIVSLATGGFTRESAIEAVVSEDMTLLVEDPNWVSVQLQQSGGGAPPAVPNGKPPVVNGGPKAPAAIAARAWEPVDLLDQARNFNPDEPRGWHGHWVSGGAIHDALKLEGKADLQPGEKLVGSDKVSGDSGTIRMALVDHGGVKSVRLGIGGSGFGARGDEAGPWRAGPDRTTEINAQSAKLRAEEKSLQAEWDRLDADPHADPVRKAAIEKRLAEIDEIGTGEVFPGGFTAKIKQSDAAHLRSRLSDALAPAVAEEARQNKVWDQIERLQAKQTLSTTEQDTLDRLKAEADGFDKLQYVFGEGVVPGDWADVYYRVVMDDDLSIGARVYLAAVPHGSGRTFEDLIGNEQGATLDPGETKKFLRLLDQAKAGA